VDDLALSAYLGKSKDRVLATLIDWLRIPSISAHPERADDVAASAAFCADLMRDAGLRSVRLLSTGSQGTGQPGAEGADVGAPAVYGEWLAAGGSAPTVLVYGHHDVQPADPLDEWLSPPFEPLVSTGEIKARGCSDDKAHVLMQIEAVRGLLAERGALPVNLKFLIEGEEEIGSPHFEDLLRREKQLLGADVVIVSDTSMLAPDLPSTNVSMRGLVSFDITLRTAASDLHSGQWGGTVPNAAVVAARIAASLHDRDRRVTVPGFYDDVRELTAQEAGSLAAIPWDEAQFCRQAGVAYLEGEAGRSPYERVGSRPTAEVVGLHSGYGGPGMKTIVPAVASLKVALRLVPDQVPDKIARAFQDWLAGVVPPGAQMTVTPCGNVAPFCTPVDHPAMRALCRSIERVWGKVPLFERGGGSGPEEALGRVLQAPLVFLGVSLPEDNFHAPNEHLDLQQLWRGIVAAGELLIELAKVKATK
jgi:acetylornithine deacetylase/succinyl-diaminopimelate desuccinylase-like protein